MAFTNLFDNTFPADSQLANLLGADCRQIRLDVQERMAAISGLDAAKPAFQNDTQPTKWNGTLFFATDTGRIYKFANPGWTDVTSAFVFKTTALKAVNKVIHTGTTTEDTIYTLVVPANTLGVNGRMRIVLYFSGDAMSGGGLAPILRFKFGGTLLNTPATPLSVSLTWWKVVIEGGNTGTTSAQLWDAHALVGSTVQQFIQRTTMAVDTTANQNFVLTCQNQVAGDQLTFDFMTIEFF